MIDLDDNLWLIALRNETLEKHHKSLRPFENHELVVTAIQEEIFRAISREAHRNWQTSMRLGPANVTIKGLRAHLVNGPGDSLTAFSDILKCLWKLPMKDSRLCRTGLFVLPSFGFNCTSSGFISFGLSSMRTIVARVGLSVMSWVHDKSAVVDDSDSGVRYAICYCCIRK